MVRKFFSGLERFKFWGKPKTQKLDLTGLQGQKPLKFKATGPMEMEAGKGRTFKGKIRKEE